MYVADSMSTEPLVTIACLTYNHGKFIEQTLDGFLAQQVDFSYEIIVHDDASTDNTQEILKRYQAKYPNIIKLVLRDMNLYSLGVTKMFYYGIIKNARGKYIATCEGDDYWIDNLKLQKQISFLESNPEYNFSVGKIKQLDDCTGEMVIKEERFDIASTKYFKVKDYLKYFFSQTSTYVFRKAGYEMPSYCNTFHGEDILMVVIGTGDGKIKYHDDIFSVYRKHSGGVTSRTFNWRMHYLDIVNYTEAIREIVGRKYFFLFKSIKLRLYLDYKMKTTSSSFSKLFFRFLSIVNNRFRWYCT